MLLRGARAAAASPALGALCAQPGRRLVLGLALGPQGGELVLVNFLGAEADRVDLALARLDPETVVQQTVKAIGQLVGRHRRIATSRIAGLGIASPFYGPDWAARLSLGPELADAWSSIDLRAEIDARFDWPVYLLSDGVVPRALK